MSSFEHCLSRVFSHCRCTVCCCDRPRSDASERDAANRTAIVRSRVDSAGSLQIILSMALLDASHEKLGPDIAGSCAECAMGTPNAAPCRDRTTIRRVMRPAYDVTCTPALVFNTRVPLAYCCMSKCHHRHLPFPNEYREQIFGRPCLQFARGCCRRRLRYY